MRINIAELNTITNFDNYDKSKQNQ